MLGNSSIYVWVSGIFGALFVLTVTYFKYSYTYWKKRNVPYAKGTMPFGSLPSLRKKHQPITMDVATIYKTMKAMGHKHAGIYMLHEPVYLPIDIELIKNIMLRDFNHFANRGVYFNEESDPLSAHLFAIEDDKWRNLRARLTPTFSSGKLKQMFEIIVKNGDRLQEAVATCHHGNASIDIKELVARYTTDVIGSCAFGIECNSFKHPDAEFRKYGRKCLESSNTKRILLITFPKLARFLGLKKIDPDVTKFFFNVVKETVQFRERNGYSRNDFMQLLIELLNQDGDALTMNELTSQAFVFFVAGFDGSSITLTYCLYELAQNMHVQDKVRAEIDEILRHHDGIITYEAVNGMKYLEQVILETLRKYPPLPMLCRVCNEAYKVPDMDLVIEKGTKVFISTYAIHHDPEFYSDPDKFDPDRFSIINKSDMKPFTYMPFGEGPRICIGARFGMLEVKVGLLSVLRNFRVRLGENTPTKLSVKRDTGTLTSNETIYLTTEKIGPYI